MASGRSVLKYSIFRYAIYATIPLALALRKPEIPVLVHMPKLKTEKGMAISQSLFLSSYICCTTKIFIICFKYFQEFQNVKCLKEF